MAVPASLRYPTDMLAIRARNACRTARLHGRADLAARALAALVAGEYRRALALAGAAVRWGMQPDARLKAPARTPGTVLAGDRGDIPPRTVADCVTPRVPRPTVVLPSIPRAALALASRAWATLRRAWIAAVP